MANVTIRQLQWLLVRIQKLEKNPLIVVAGDFKSTHKMGNHLDNV